MFGTASNGGLNWAGYFDGNVRINGNVSVFGDNSNAITLGPPLAGGIPLIFEGMTADDYETMFAITNPTADQVIAFPNATGTVVTTGNLADITAVGTITSGTWNGATIATGRGGTGTTALGAAGSVAFSTGSAYGFSGVGISGQILLSGGTGVPTWGSANAHAHDASAITGGTLPILRGGTNATTVGAGGSVNYSTGSAHAYSAAGTTGQILHSGGGSAPTWAAVNLATETTGTLPAGNGGTGLAASGTSGNYLRSNGSLWTSSAILAGDLPAAGTPYLRKNAADTSTASSAGHLYTITNSSNTSGSGVLNGIMSSSSAGSGTFYGLRGESGIGDNTNDASSVVNYGIYSLANGSTQISGGTTNNYGLRSYATGGAGAGTTANYGIYSTASGGTTNWAGYFAGDVYVSGNTVLGSAHSDGITINGKLRNSDALWFEGDTIDNFSTVFLISDPTAARTITFPDMSGTVVTTGNLADITAVGTVASGTWNGAVIDTAHGGTGLASSGVSGRYLRSTGSAWASSAIQAVDLPAGSSHYLAKDESDTSSAAALGILYSLTNTSAVDGAIVLAASIGATESAGGGYTALYASSGVHDNHILGGATRNYGAYCRANGVADQGMTYNYGVYGIAHAATNGMGITDNYGVYGTAAGGDTNYAGYFSGNVNVAGTLSKTAGTFKIDHPLDPANKTLSHSFVESPDMMNVYNGNAVLDAKGEAVVTMPGWFEALNRDFRYQLTPVGGPAPDLHVADKVSGGRFRIAGGRPGLEVSWQVTGIRQDPYALKHPVVVEEEKSARDRGRYLAPEAYGLPQEMGIGYHKPPESPKATAQAR